MVMHKQNQILGYGNNTEKILEFSLGSFTVKKIERFSNIRAHMFCRYIAEE